LEPGGGRRARPEILPQGGNPGAPEKNRRKLRALVSVALGRRRSGAGPVAQSRALRFGDFRPASVRPARRRLDLLGLEGALLQRGSGRARLLRRDALHAGAPDGGAQFAAMVQHRPALGLWHRWAGAGPLLRRLRDGKADEIQIVLRTSPATRLFHPVGRRRSRQRGRHNGSMGARGAPVPISRRCAARTRSFRAAAAPAA
jgi:hypothetical protein